MRFVTFILLFVCTLRASASDHTPTTSKDAPTATPHRLHDLERYELEAIEAELEKRGWEHHPDPEGHAIDEVTIVNLDIFQSRDPYPTLFNELHINTKPWVIERELLFGSGSQWGEDHVYETERILRRWLFLSWVRVIPARVKSQASQTTTNHHSDLKVLVISQDLWSLRASFDFSYVGSRLELLNLAVTESNFLGQSMRLGPTFSLDLGKMSFGGTISNYRFGRTAYGGEANASLITNRASGAYEGETANLLITRPLIRLDDIWGGEFQISHNRDIYRSFTSGALAAVTIPETGESALLTYQRRTLDLHLQATRSSGRAFKSNWTVGYGYFNREYPLIQSGLQAATQSLFTSRYLPVSESAGLLYVKWDGYRANYVRKMNLDSYAVTEDVREGIIANASLSYASRFLGGGSEYLLPSFGIGHNWFLGDAILTASTQINTRIQPGVDTRTPFVNRNTTSRIKFYSGYFLGKWRWVAGGTLITHGFDRYRTQETLGSDSTLRGFPSGWLRGSTLLTFTQEVRSVPIHFLSTYIGIAAFQDWGDAFDDWGNMRLRPTLGAGLRVAFPQFNRDVVRFDIGFPLHALDASLGPTTVIQFSQAI